MNGNPEMRQSDPLTDIERASETGALLLCSISLFEIAAYAQRGRIVPSIPIRDWIDESVETPGLRLVPIDAALAAEAATLPGNFTGDGADRLIVAAARLFHATLITADETIAAYGAEGHLRIGRL
jgi:PIN domain nuclease of toxin-antitoxin system